MGGFCNTPTGVPFLRKEGAVGPERQFFEKRHDFYKNGQFFTKLKNVITKRGYFSQNGTILSQNGTILRPSVMVRDLFESIIVRNHLFSSVHKRFWMLLNYR